MAAPSSWDDFLKGYDTDAPAAAAKPSDQVAKPAAGGPPKSWGEFLGAYDSEIPAAAAAPKPAAIAPSVSPFDYGKSGLPATRRAPTIPAPVESAPAKPKATVTTPALDARRLQSGYAPGPPAPPLPEGLDTASKAERFEDQHGAGSSYTYNRFGERIVKPELRSIEDAPGLLHAPFTGAERVIEGVEQFADEGARNKAGGAAKIIGGGMEALTPMIPAALARAPLSTGAGLVAGGVSEAQGYKALRALGVPEEYAQLASTVLGAAAAGFTARKVGSFERVPDLGKRTDQQIIEGYQKAADTGDRGSMFRHAEEAQRRQAARQAERTLEPAATETPAPGDLEPSPREPSYKSPYRRAASEPAPRPANWDEFNAPPEVETVAETPQQTAVTAPQTAAVTRGPILPNVPAAEGERAGSQNIGRYRAGKPGIALESPEGEDARGRAFVYRDEKGEPKGYLHFYLDDELKGVAPPEHEAFPEVFVSPEARRKGIGTELYKAAETAGYDLSQVSGSETTPAGAALLNSRAGRATDRGPGWVGNVPTDEIEVDAPRFQFKANVGQGGAGEELRAVRKWDPEKAGVIAVWKDPADGKSYVVNGHHRLELAKRTGTPEITARYLTAGNAIEARTKGALINIAEGRGESTDAAKVFRDMGMTPAELESEGVSLTGKVAKEGLSLSRLANPLFEQVIAGDLSPARGAAIGAGLPEHADQLALYDAIQAREKSGKRPTNDQIEELIRLVQGSSKVTESTADQAQGGLFGDEEITRSLWAEKAEISDYVRKQLATEKRLFGAVSSQAAAERLETGGNVIKAGENAKVAESASQGIDVYDRLSTKAGNIDGILDRAARSLVDGESPNEVKKRAYRDIRAEVTSQIAQLTGVSKSGAAGVEGLGAEGAHPVSEGQLDTPTKPLAARRVTPAGPSLFDEPPEPGRGYSDALYRGTEGKTRGGELRESPVGELGRGVYVTPHKWLAATYGGGPTANVKHGTREVHHMELRQGLRPSEVAFLDGGSSGDVDAVLTLGSGGELWRGRITGKKVDRPLIEAMNEAARKAGAKLIIGGKHSLAINQAVVLDPAVLKKPRKLSPEEALARDEKPITPDHATHKLAGAEQTSLVTPKAEAESRAIATKTAAELEGERLTAQIKSGGAARPAKLKPKETASLFEEEPDQGGLFLKRIGGPKAREAMPLAEALPEARIEHAIAGAQRYPVLAVNAQALNVIGGGDFSGHLGVTYTDRQALQLVNRLDAHISSARGRGFTEAGKQLQTLRDALVENRKRNNGRPMVIIQTGPNVTPAETRGAIQEELDHALQIQSTGHLPSDHIDTDAFLVDTPEGAIAAKTLRETYDNISDADLAMEVGVRLMRPGRYRELGLTAEQAVTLANQYADLLEAQHGARVSEIIEKTYNAFGKTAKTTFGARRGIRQAEFTERPQAAQRKRGPPKGDSESSGSLLEGVGPLNPPLAARRAKVASSPDVGPEFTKKEPLKKSVADFMRPVRSRIQGEGVAGRELMRKVDRAETLGTVRSGLRITRLNESGLKELPKDARFGSKDSLLDMLQGNAPLTGPSGDVALKVRRLLEETANEAINYDVKTRQQRTFRPADPLPAGVKLTPAQQARRTAGQRIFVTWNQPFRPMWDYAPHIIPSAEELREGPKRLDAIANMVHEGTARDRQEAADVIDDWRRYAENGGRAKKLEQNLINSGQARDAQEARVLLGRMRKSATKREGTLEYSRAVKLPFYDPDMLRVMPQWLASRSMRLAQIHELGQDLGKGQRDVEKLLGLIKAGNGNEAFVRASLRRGLGMLDEAANADARIARLVMTWHGFKLGLAFVPNAFQGGINTLLHTHDPILTGRAMGRMMTKSGRRFASESGVTLDGIINEMVRTVSTQDDVLGRGLEKFLSVSFTPTERANRIVAANAGAMWGEKMLARLKRNPKDGLALQELRAIGLDPAKLLKIGKLDGPALLVAAKRFTDMTQFRSGVFDQPDWATASTLGKVIWQFKNYSYQQFRLAYDDSVGEIQRGRPGRGLMTFAILATVFPIAGEVINDIRGALQGRTRTPASFTRYMEDLVQGGAIAMIADMLMSGTYGGGASYLAGPTISEGGDLLNALGQTVKNPHNLNPLGKFLFKKIPLAGPLLVNRVFPGKKEPGAAAARRDVRGKGGIR